MSYKIIYEKWIKNSKKSFNKIESFTLKYYYLFWARGGGKLFWGMTREEESWLSGA